MMSTWNFVSAARPPLYPRKMQAASFSPPMACSPSVCSRTQTSEGTKYGYSSIPAHQPSNAARRSPSPPALSPHAAGMLPRSNEISRGADPTDITAARTLLQLQSCVGSDSMDIANDTNVREEALIRKAETPRPTTGMAAACVRTHPNAARSPRVPAVICDASCLRICTKRVTRGVGALRISHSLHQVGDDDPAAPGSRTNLSGRKHRLDAPTSERPAKRARVQATRLATKEAADADKGRPSSEMLSGHKRKRHGDTSGAPLRKKRRVTAFATIMRYDPMEVC